MNMNVQKLAAAFEDQAGSLMSLIYDYYAEFHSYDNPVAKRYVQELRKLADASGNGDEIMVRMPPWNDSRTAEVRHPDRRKQTPLPPVRQLEKLVWGPA